MMRHLMQRERWSLVVAVGWPCCSLVGFGCMAAPQEPPAVVVGTGGRWEQLAPLSSPRQEHAVVAFGGEVIVVGGFDDTTTVAAVDAFDPVANGWRSLPPLPLPLHHPNAAVVDGGDGGDGQRLVVGGFLLGADFRQDARTLVFDGAAWREGASHPPAEARGASATCAIDGAVYVFGGLNIGSTAQASRYVVDDDRWEPLPPLPRRLDHVLCVPHDGALWIVSGRENGLGNHTGTLLRFDPVSQTYSERSPMPTSRAGAAAAVVGDGITAALYVVGGEGNAEAPSGVFASAERYLFAEDRWAEVVGMRTPRHGMGAAVIDGAVYVPGGATVQGFGAVDVHERFVPEP